MQSRDLEGHCPKICTCLTCMDSQLSKAEVSTHEQPLKSTMVDRKNPDGPDISLMKSISAKAVLTAGGSVNLASILELDAQLAKPKQAKKVIEPQELIVRAVWKNKNQEQATSGRDASVFGALGVLLFNSETVTIPQMNAAKVPPAFLKRYGAKLIPLDEPVKLNPAEHPSLENLYLIEYNFNEQYVADYALKFNGGGGIFVETHPFPQIFTPLSPQCSGALILGIDLGQDRYSFSAFKIPFGYTMKIKSMAIHGDSFFVGSYAIALNETDLADSVLIRQNTPNRDVAVVTLTKIPPTLFYHDGKTPNEESQYFKHGTPSSPGRKN